MRKSNTARILGLILAAAMLTTSVPFEAFAEPLSAQAELSAEEYDIPSEAMTGEEADNFAAIQEPDVSGANDDLSGQIEITDGTVSDDLIAEDLTGEDKVSDNLISDETVSADEVSANEAEDELSFDEDKSLSDNEILPEGEPSAEPKVEWLRPGADASTIEKVLGTDQTGLLGTGVESRIYKYSAYGTEYLALYVTSSSTASLNKSQVKNIYSGYTNTLKDIILDDTITEIQTEGMFANLSGVSHVRLSATLNSFSQKLFENCTSLTDITIPKTLVSAVGNTFWGCSSLKTITFEPGIKKIPDNVASNGDNGAHNCSLKMVYIPSSVKEIGECAFLYQYNLERVIFMDPAKTTLSHIGRKAFCNTNLSGIDLPKFGGTWKDNGGNTNRPAIGSLAFAGIRNTAFETFVVPEGVVSIYEIWQNDVYPGNHWKYVYLPSTLKRYDNARDMGLLQAFFYAEPTELVHVYYNGSRSQFFTKTLGKNTKKLQDAWINTLGSKLTFSKVVFNTPAPKPVSKLTPPSEKYMIVKYLDEVTDGNMEIIQFAISPTNHVDTVYKAESTDEAVVQVGSVGAEANGKLPITLKYHKHEGSATITVSGGLATTRINVRIKQKEQVAEPILKINGKSPETENEEVKKGDWVIAESATLGSRIEYQTKTGSGSWSSWREFPNGIRIGTSDGLFGGAEEGTVVYVRARASKTGLRTSEESEALKLTYKLDRGDVGSYDLGERTEIPEGLWIGANFFAAPNYTGSAIKASDLGIRVFYYNKLLRSGKDYTVTYSDNVAAVNVSGKNAKLTVKGKSPYSGTAGAEFVIKPNDMYYWMEADYNYTPATVKYTGGEQTPDIKLTYLGKKQTRGSDYTIQYEKAGGSIWENSVKEPGEYHVLVTGDKNFTGSIELYSSVWVIDTENYVSMGDVKAAKIKDQQLVKSGVGVEPAVKVTYQGKAVSNEAYTVSYKRNTTAGTATATLTGTNNWVTVGGKTVRFRGTKTVTFKIKPINMKKVTVTVPSAIYSGTALRPSPTVKLGEDLLYFGIDYTVSYKNNVKAGKGTVIITGKGAFKGKKSVKFKIEKATLEDADVILSSSSYPYTAGGVIPKVSVSKAGVHLSKKDYSITYSGNKAPGPASLIVKGKGNLTGTVTKTFTINQANLANCRMTLQDKIYSSKANKFKQKIVIKDTNGKKLKAGRDYNSMVAYKYSEDTVVTQKVGKTTVRVLREAGDDVEKKDIIPAGTTIFVNIDGKGNYGGRLTRSFRFGRKKISSLKFSIANQKYTGSRVLPGKDGIKGEGVSGDYYEIISYGTNIKGTGTVTVRGLGNYIGTKTIKFKIK